jgi:hypothetical protein
MDHVLLLTQELRIVWVNNAAVMVAVVHVVLVMMCVVVIVMSIMDLVTAEHVVKGL